MVQEDAQSCVVALKHVFVSDRKRRLTKFRAIAEIKSYPTSVLEGLHESDVDHVDMFKASNTVSQLTSAILEWLQSEGVDDGPHPAVDGVNDPVFVLVSGDPGFSALLNRIRFRMNVETVVVHPKEAPGSLTKVATRAVPFDDFLPSMGSKTDEDSESVSSERQEIEKKKRVRTKKKKDKPTPSGSEVTIPAKLQVG